MNELLELLEPNNELTETEQSRLKFCELVIMTGIKTFKEVGQALLEIKENKLYRQTHKTFDDYCQDKWDIKRRHAYQMIEAKKTYDNLCAMADKPETERQIRPLAKLEPEVQREVWQEATSNNPKPTGEVIRELVKEKQGLNGIVKTLKSQNLLVFESEKDLIEYAKGLLPEPEPKIIEKENTDKINELKSQVDYFKGIADRNDAITKKNIYLNDELLKLDKELKSFKNKDQEIKDRENKIKITLEQIAKLKEQQSQLLSDAENLDIVLKGITAGVKVFQEQLFIIPALSLNPGTKEALKPKITELLTMVNNWQYALAEKFLNNNQIGE